MDPWDQDGLYQEHEVEETCSSKPYQEPTEQDKPRRRLPAHMVRGVIVYAAWLTIHNASAQLYPHYCAPAGITGFLASSVYATSPQCVALRWGITRGAVALNTMWVFIASWFASHLVLPG